MHKNLKRSVSGLAIALAAALPLASQAQAKADEWKFDAVIYGWFPSIGGKTSFPATGSGPSIDVTADDILDALKFTFMGNLGVRKGQWGAWTDVIYLDVGATKSATRDATVGNQALPVGVDANVDLDLKSWIWTLAGTYTLIDSPEHRMDVLAGARMINVETQLNWSFNGNIASLPLPGRSGSSTVEVTNWDAIVGLKGRASFDEGRKWFVPYYIDVGTGQSKFTWQGIVGVGYNFDWGSVIAAWRYLDYDFKDSSRIETIDFNGPAIGVGFRW
ncbi:MAG: hypothetical protein ACRED3_13905 [Bradyrhizobium sp.]